MILLCVLLTMFILAFDLSIPLGVAGGVPYVAVVLVTLWLPGPRYTLIFVVICTVLTVLGFFISPAGGMVWQVVVNRLLAVFAIWVTGILSIQRKNIENSLQNHRDQLSNIVEQQTFDLKKVNEQLRIEIRETTQAKAKLQEEEARIKAILDTAMDAIISIDEQGMITSFNPATERIFGYTKKELTGKNLGTLMPSPYREEHSRYIRNYLETGKRKTIGFCRELPAMRKNGDIFPIELSVAEIRDERGCMFTGVVRDVSERKKVEEELISSQAKYKDLYNNAPDMFVSVDAATGIIVECNQTLLTTTGYSKEEIIGHHVSEIYHPDCEAMRTKAFQTFTRTGQVAEAELILKRKDGATIDISLSVSAVRDKDGTILRSRSILRNISKSKQAEKALEQSREELRNLSEHLQLVLEEERKSLARTIHDELGQSLTALKINASWLKTRLLENDGSLRERAEVLINLSNRAIQTVKRIWTKIRPELLDDLGLAAAIEWEAKQFQRDSGIPCHAIIDSEEINLNSKSSIAIYRIFQESLTNIARHAKASKITAHLKENNGQLILKISDNGKGIPKNKVSATNSLGLLGMRERARFLGGRLSITGKKDHGTVVTLTVPIT